MTETPDEPQGYGLQDILDAALDSLENEPVSPYRVELTRQSAGVYVGRVYIEAGEDYVPLSADLDNA